MSAPAVVAWRHRHAETQLMILARAGPAAVWKLLNVADRVCEVSRGCVGAWRAGRLLRAWRPQCVAVCPHSIRSAWIAWRSGAQEIRGLPGAARRWMGIHVVQPAVQPGRRHQQYEYADLLGLDTDCELKFPRIQIPAEMVRVAEAKLAPMAHRPRVAVMPGAARGPAKRWPADRFAEVARRLAMEESVEIIVLGTAEDRMAAEMVASAAGAASRNLAGETTIELWAAVLSCCDLALCNDSGGMHLAAAVGLPGVAIFGRTDPAVTGPLSPGWTILRAAGAATRDVGRKDRQAIQSLLSVNVEDVVQACRQHMAALRHRSDGGLSKPCAGC